MRPGRLLTATLVSVCALAGCTAVGPRDPARPDASFVALGQDSRVRHLVVHYTVTNFERSLALLTQGEVSTHYLVSDERPPRILQLVDESRSAWHAGSSRWHGQRSLNATSIGIEIVNSGNAAHDIVPGMPGRGFQAFAFGQLARTAALMADIASRHDLAQENIVAHGDIAPQRKHDPGPLFPWRALAAKGVGRWFDEKSAAQAALRHWHNGLPGAAWFQAELARAGYDVPRHGVWDARTRRVLAVFQMHYRPEIHDGMPDAVSAGILGALPTRGTAQGYPQLAEPPLGATHAPTASTLHAQTTLFQRATIRLLRGDGS